MCRPAGWGRTDASTVDPLLLINLAGAVEEPRHRVPVSSPARICQRMPIPEVRHGEVLSGLTTKLPIPGDSLGCIRRKDAVAIKLRSFPGLGVYLQKE